MGNVALVSLLMQPCRLLLQLPVVHDLQAGLCAAKNRFGAVQLMSAVLLAHTVPRQLLVEDVEQTLLCTPEHHLRPFPRLPLVPPLVGEADAVLEVAAFEGERVHAVERLRQVGAPACVDLFDVPQLLLAPFELLVVLDDRRPHVVHSHLHLLLLPQRLDLVLRVVLRRLAHPHQHAAVVAHAPGLQRAHTRQHAQRVHVRALVVEHPRHELQRLGVPHADDAVDAAGPDAPAARVLHQRRDGSVTVVQELHQVAGLRVPHLHRAVSRRGEQVHLLEHERLHCVAVPDDGPHVPTLLHGVQVPAADGVVAAARVQGAALHAEAVHGVLVPAELHNEAERYRVPLQDLPVPRPREDGPAHGHHARDRTRVLLHLEGELVRLLVEDPQTPVGQPTPHEPAVAQQRAHEAVLFAFDRNHRSARAAAAHADLTRLLGSPHDLPRVVLARGPHDLDGAEETVEALDVADALGGVGLLWHGLGLLDDVAVRVDVPIVLAEIEAVVRHPRKHRHLARSCGNLGVQALLRGGVRPAASVSRGKEGLPNEVQIL
eukprot:Rhum_TRINITY_DN14423_c8_g1::Rhum_TRINITY_DN14423_c8_g1_i1::g.88978::m.88978